MNKFIVIYHASASAQEQMASASPEEVKKGMEPWMAWAKRCGSDITKGGAPGSYERTSKRAVHLSFGESRYRDSAAIRHGA